MLSRWDRAAVPAVAEQQPSAADAPVRGRRGCSDAICQRRRGRSRPGVPAFESGRLQPRHRVCARRRARYHEFAPWCPPRRRQRPRWRGGRSRGRAPGGDIEADPHGLARSGGRVEGATRLRSGEHRDPAGHRALVAARLAPPRTAEHRDTRLRACGPGGVAVAPAQSQGQPHTRRVKGVRGPPPLGRCAAVARRGACP